MSDQELEEKFVAALDRMYPEFSAANVLACRVSRAGEVMAVSTWNDSENIPADVTSLPGVYVVNSSQILHGTLNVNENIKLADQAFETILQDIPKTGSINTEEENGKTNCQLVAGSR